MSSAVIAYLLMDALEETTERVRRKILRDKSNPLELPESLFIDQFRLNKEAFVIVLDAIKDKLDGSSVPAVLQLAAALRFFAEGSYQRSVGNDVNVCLARSTVSMILKDVLNALERSICRRCVKLVMEDAEKQRARNYFYNKYRIPGITGCIDGTHIRIVKPKNDEHLYFNRKGYFSINAMIICDNDMIIRGIDARYPGSSHDSFVWSISSARQYYLRQYEAGDRTNRLLGDCGYGIEPFLLTPYRDPEYNSREYKFNMAHSSARNIVERTIGVLKSRFRCLMRTLHYRPEQVVKIINGICALHNICRSYNIEFVENIPQPTESSENEIVTPLSLTLQNEGQRIRNEIANSL